MTAGADLRAAIVAVVSAVLKVPAEQIAAGITPDTVDGWDSERHVELVVALEDHFGCQFEADEVPELTSLERMQEIIARHAA